MLDEFPVDPVENEIVISMIAYAQDRQSEIKRYQNAVWLVMNDRFFIESKCCILRKRPMHSIIFIKLVGHYVKTFCYRPQMIYWLNKVVTLH